MYSHYGDTFSNDYKRVIRVTNTVIILSTSKLFVSMRKLNFTVKHFRFAFSDKKTNKLEYTYVVLVNCTRHERFERKNEGVKIVTGVTRSARLNNIY